MDLPAPPSDKVADKPALRLLQVVEVMARTGPAQLADLVAAAAIPRGAVWRSLDLLRQQGWARMRHGDNAWVLCSHITALMAAAPHTPPEVEQVLPLFDHLASSGRVHVDLGRFVARGDFRVIETTRKDGYGGGSLSLIDDDIALAGQLTLSPPDLVRNLTAFMERATPEERQVVSSGEHARQLRRLRDGRAVWHEDGTAVAIALDARPGVALRVELWRVSKSRIAALREVISAILSKGLPEQG